MKKQTIKIGEIANYEDGLVRGRKEGRLSAQEEIKGLKNSIAKLILENVHIRENTLADVEKIIWKFQVEKYNPDDNPLWVDSQWRVDLLQEIARLRGEGK